MKRHLLATLALLFAMPVMALATALDIFPDSDIGRRAAAYIEAFNSGSEETMRTFIVANVAKKGLEQRPAEERLRIYRQMRDEHKTLTPVRGVGASDTEVEIIARTGGGDELDLTFMFEAEAPHGMMGIRIMDAGNGGGPPPDAGRSTPLPDDQAAKVWGAWLDSLTRADQFSGAVLFAKDDQVLFQHAYGLASRKDKARNTTATRFNLGSINKMFTMLAIAQLVDQGKVKLDDTIDRYLPDYPRAVASKVTVRQLLEHKGGVGDIFGDTYDAADRSKLRNVSDWIPLFRDKPLAFEPGTSQQYSNGGYVLLGAIVEKASGEDYYDYVRRHIYGPIGMKHTDSYAEDETVANRARGYTRHSENGAKPDASGWADNFNSRPMRGSPAGGGYSTLEDLLAFTKALRGGKLVRPETLAEFRMLGAGGIGFAGGAPGINAGVEMSGPYTIIALTNMDPPTAEGAVRKMRGMVPGPSGNMKRITIPHAGEGHGTSSSNEGGAPAPGQMVTRVAAAEGADASFPPGATVIRHEAGSSEPIPPGASLVRREAGADAPTKSFVPESGVDVAMTSSNHLPTVQVMVNGKGPFLFGLDTGGAGSLRIDSTLAVKLGLEKVGQVRAGDPSGKNTRVMDVVSVGSVEVGGAKFEGMTAAVRSYNERRRDEPIDGILGFTLFRECLLTLDYPANRLRIDRGALPPPDGKQVIPFTLRHGIPSIQLQVDSLTVDADIDAGSMGGLSLPIALAAKLPLATALKVVGHARTVSNEFDIQGAELNGNAKLGGWELSHPMVDFQPIFPMGNVGSRVLKDFKVTFDQKLGRMRLVRGA